LFGDFETVHSNFLGVPNTVTRDVGRMTLFQTVADDRRRRDGAVGPSRSRPVTLFSAGFDLATWMARARSRRWTP
jgi:hypothetical protein